MDSLWSVRTRGVMVVIAVIASMAGCARPSADQAAKAQAPAPSPDSVVDVAVAPSSSITKDPLPQAVSIAAPPALSNAGEPAKNCKTWMEPGIDKPIKPGLHGSIHVLAPTRLDWQFVVKPNEFEPSSPRLPSGYKSTNQIYQLFVPADYDASRQWPLVLCVSPGDGPCGWPNFEPICRSRGVIFASPMNTGNEQPFALRARIVLDVLDDVRRRLSIDPDRVYLSGMSGGGRVASRVAFALPEACAGLLPICGSYSLRDEPWVRLRVAERQSVVFLEGETDFLRAETEREYLPIMNAYNVRAKLVVYPGGHTIPPENVLRDAFLWVEAGLEQRRKLAQQFAFSSMAHPLSAEEWSSGLVDEGMSRLGSQASASYGILQLRGAALRWRDSMAAKRVRKELDSYNRPGQPTWEQIFHDERLRFALLQSRAFDDHMLGPAPQGFPFSREPLWGMLKLSWQETLYLARSTPYAAEAEARLEALKKR
jgi:predicted esterase